MKQPFVEKIHALKTIAVFAYLLSDIASGQPSWINLSKKAEIRPSAYPSGKSNFEELKFNKQVSTTSFELLENPISNLLTPSNPNDLLQQINPGLLDSGCRLVFKNSRTSKNRVSEYFKLECHGYPVESAEVAIHSNGEFILMLQGYLPSRSIKFSMTKEELDAISSFDHRSKIIEFSHIQEKRLGLCAPTEIDQTKANNSSNTNLFPCWVLNGTDVETGIRHLVRADAMTGALHSAIPQAFDLSTVYQNGPQDGETIKTELPHLDESGYLNGKHFEVYAPFEGDERVFSQDSNFNFSPSSEIDEFDQVQAYYGASKTLAWFKKQFDYDFGDELIKIRVHANIAGSKNNAKYQPDEGNGPEILLGTGDGITLENISRDTDVIAHEFSHHIVFHRVKTSKGESGLIHEGISDYFAYAINDDPHLAESVKIGSPWLRTAEISTEFRFDDPNLGWKPHEMAQIFSAVLWDVREVIGIDMDQIVYYSIDYLQDESGIKDAILGLLNADRDLYPLTPDDPESEIYGIHKCEIIGAAVNHGFSLYLDGINGDSCEMNISELVEESKEFSDQKRLEEERKKQGKAGDFKIFGRPCAVIHETSESGRTYLLWLMLIPIMFGFLSSLNPKRTRINEV